MIPVDYLHATRVIILAIYPGSETVALATPKVGCEKDRVPRMQIHTSPVTIVEDPESDP